MLDRAGQLPPQGGVDFIKISLRSFQQHQLLRSKLSDAVGQGRADPAAGPGDQNPFALQRSGRLCSIESDRGAMEKALPFVSGKLCC
jgi:hypothetical protein